MGDDMPFWSHPTMRRKRTHMDMFRLRKERKRKNPAGVGRLNKTTSYASAANANPVLCYSHVDSNSTSSSLG
eukprot:scaffold2892_cov118-Skeletonema_menzelii.AAC.1